MSNPKLIIDATLYPLIAIMEPLRIVPMAPVGITGEDFLQGNEDLPLTEGGRFYDIWENPTRDNLIK